MRRGAETHTTKLRVTSSESLLPPRKQPKPLDPPHALYARQLAKLGYGLPLWHPEPSATGDVEIGDVGYVDNGRFVRMFNTVDSTVRSANRGVLPKGYTLFKIEPQYLVTTGLPSRIWTSSTISDESPPSPTKSGRSPSSVDSEDPCTTSPAIRPLDSSSPASSSSQESRSSSSPSPPSSPPPASSSSTSHDKFYSFSVRGRNSAVLIAMDKATRQYVRPHAALTQYVQEYHKVWQFVARAVFGLIIRGEDLVFITGHVKTTNRWIALTTTGSGRVDVKVQGPDEDVSVIVKSPNFTFSFHHGLGPPAVAARKIREINLTAGLIKPADAKAMSNHCLFVSLYRVKKRLFFPALKLVANAEPRDDDSLDDESDGAVVVTDGQLDQDNYATNMDILDSLAALLSSYLDSAMLVHGGHQGRRSIVSASEILVRTVASPLCAS
ncbi:hypothetical protein PHLGIDRAFT_127238 [Phlebiopsis gigantea 11061_1 CR5-6]|uniref:Uncharacterized protein n=1 Tax=Phlebiopsis gigantea (strain 11061_1 CR5-6) TaxID=745531 RepID=A0A0C3S995_PHLG1|nr:hypothetical protein PHLGIDRAFT_127238 [Phlebiopsis gigantea 11061_1 CR5-6]